MKNFSLQELQEGAAEIAKANNVNKVFATNDGQYFVNENFAKLHARQNKLDVYPIEIPEETPAPEVKKASVEERIAAVKAMDNIVDIENFIANEKAKTVLTAATERQAELKAADLASDERQKS